MIVLKSSSQILNAFYNTESTKNRGKLRAIEQQLYHGNATAVAAILSSLTPDNIIEENQKTFLSIVKNFEINQDLTASDSTSLHDLIYKCPFTDGAVIYQARALYNKVYKAHKLLNDDDCISTGIANGRIQTNLAKYQKNESQKYFLFPNPTSGKTFIKSNTSIGNVRVSVADITGKLVYKEVIESKDSVKELDLELMEGLYIVTIDSNNSKINFKLVITK